MGGNPLSQTENEKGATYKLPPLPYDFNALEPIISAEIMTLHYKKHHQAYVDNLNKGLEQYHDAECKGDLQTMIALEKVIRFNGGGHINHSIFWTNLAPQSNGGGGAPSGKLAEAINKKWGSHDKFVEQFNAATIAIQGSGWGWLGYCKKNQILKIATCSNQDPLSTQGLIPLLGVDVWEHAYYLQYKNVRADYVKAIGNIINWKNVAERFAAASA
jgi:Fe-Mn family superoxide dismutase